MSAQPIITPTPPEKTKLQLFLEELNVLTERYQYALVPTLEIKNTGIVPSISVNDVPPKPINKPIEQSKQEKPKGGK